ncbi:hypothetical protein CORC01_12933 [Colletotrichum orchidophilum]|uniref:Uncharacterized protein n=1 Tax=Colletotrichum orchidophilum TaxID=1209926 RepID=A0A1G4ARH2_9PEZI|nr:uncharacterized protein CORC01_12933 [Colletotrichum orchidophilum]OHE91759.1 hypothetical protein CORC01_12933 [Colletotrichum orchidophilum]
MDNKAGNTASNRHGFRAERDSDFDRHQDYGPHRRLRSRRAVCTGTAPTTAPTATAVSYVPNAYFPFPYIATSLDRGECSSALSQCSRNYQSCVTQLDGNAGFGVTVVIPGGGGTTVAATRPDVGTSATPICSSLSSQACYGLSNDQCAQSTTVNGVVINAAARPTAACVARLAAGLGIAVFGAMR